MNNTLVPAGKRFDIREKISIFVRMVYFVLTAAATGVLFWAPRCSVPVSIAPVAKLGGPELSAPVKGVKLPAATPASATGLRPSEGANPVFTPEEQRQIDTLAEPILANFRKRIEDIEKASAETVVDRVRDGYQEVAVNFRTVDKVEAMRMNAEIVVTVGQTVPERLQAAVLEKVTESLDLQKLASASECGFFIRNPLDGKGELQIDYGSSSRKVTGLDAKDNSVWVSAPNHSRRDEKFGIARFGHLFHLQKMDDDPP